MGRTFKISPLLIIFLIIIGSPAFADGGWGIGDQVLVNWSGDDYWYPATIVDEEGGEFFVIFDDGDREWVLPDDIAPDDLAEGDRIQGNWQGGGVYYPGYIAERRGNAVLIEYDDGDVEATTIGFLRVE